MAKNRVLKQIRRLCGVGLVLASACACTIFNRPIVYEEAKETQPLQMPDGLRAPAPNPALSIPSVEGLAAAPDTSPPSLGNTVAVARGGLPRSVNAVLQMQDEAANTWRRVGIALDRSGCCRVVSKDEAELKYEVELSAETEKPGFFKRMFGGTADTSMVVRVESRDAGSQVSVVDAEGATRRDDAAMTVLGVVESRLQ
jgi:uncharacterized lipoprotein